MATLIALVNVAAECGSSAERNIPERSFLLSAERILERSQISWTVDAKNIGQLQRRRRHQTGIWSIGKGNRSSGLTVERTARFETCRYLAVVFRLRCPIRIWMRRKSVASSSRWGMAAYIGNEALKIAFKLSRCVIRFIPGTNWNGYAFFGIKRAARGNKAAAGLKRDSRLMSQPDSKGDARVPSRNWNERDSRA